MAQRQLQQRGTQLIRFLQITAQLRIQFSLRGKQRVGHRIEGVQPVFSNGGGELRQLLQL